MATTELQPTAYSLQPLVNVADRLTAVAQKLPDGVAVACPGQGDVAGENSYATCSFAELERDAIALTRGLVEWGVEPGMRLVLLVRPGIEFVKLVFGLLRSGATTVLIDPGMGRRHLVDCLAATEPDGFVAISAAQAMRRIAGRRFPSARFNLTVGRRWFWGGKTFDRLLKSGRRSSAALPTTRADDRAAIIFTSGSTGPPKGVLYTHQMFETQVAEIQRGYDIQPGGADLACFALFGLFNSAMGVTTVFPDMDFSRPASADPAKLLAAARDWRVTQAFASPAVWRNLSEYLARCGEQIPTLRNVFSCGAPVPAAVLRRTLDGVAADANMYTPYGATECLPVATIEAEEVLGETDKRTTQGAGVCVGRRFDTIEWRIIRITDESIEDYEELPQGEIGELIVRGPQVSPEYVVTRDSQLETHNSLTKIPDGDTIWHRMGDVGYLDDQQRFWYCGRKVHRVETSDATLFTMPCEAVFNTHPQVRRTALVGVGPRLEQTPVIVVELNDADAAKPASDLRRLAEAHTHTAGIERFLFHGPLPVDVRHNSKINREQLAAWATKQLAGESL